MKLKSYLYAFLSSWVYFITPWLCLSQISVYGAQLSSEACRELGFSSNLLCSSCNLLGQFNLNQLDPFCRQCCQEEAQLETRKVCQQGRIFRVLERIHPFK
uniref:Selenoprotein F n=1 Tax=Strix occidentalis caurina TaxID=311401 RepID=A0A8D0FJX4_STROC